MMTVPKRKKTPKKSKASKSPKRAKAPKKKTKPKRPDGTCFVLMPFSEPFETYYEAIFRPAVLNANLKITRADSLFASTPIMGDVWRFIQEADVLLAELTGRNPNVFYELGLGHAIGKPIVLVSETLADVPFDLQGLRVNGYDRTDPAWGAKLKKSITAALLETLSSPIDKVPSMFRKKVKSQAPVDTEVNVRLDALERRVASISPSDAQILGRRRAVRGVGARADFSTFVGKECSAHTGPSTLAILLNRRVVRGGGASRPLVKNLLREGWGIDIASEVLKLAERF